MAFAPDALFPLGGYPGDEDKARELFPKLDQAKTREDFVTGAEWLKARPETNGKVGAVGFCYGGRVGEFLGARPPEPAAGRCFPRSTRGLTCSCDDATASRARPVYRHLARLPARWNCARARGPVRKRRAGARCRMHLRTWRSRHLSDAPSQALGSGQDLLDAACE